MHPIIKQVILSKKYNSSRQSIIREDQWRVYQKSFHSDPKYDGNIRYFWHRDLIDVLMLDYTDYKFSVKIQTEQKIETKLELVPVIKGGGIIMDL